MATLNANINSSQGWLPLSEADALSLPAGLYTVDSENIDVGGLHLVNTAHTWSPADGRWATRHVGGSTAATHLSGATLTPYYIDAPGGEGSGIPQGGPLTEDLDAGGFGIIGADDGSNIGARLTVGAAAATFGGSVILNGGDDATGNVGAQISAYGAEDGGGGGGFDLIAGVGLGTPGNPGGSVTLQAGSTNLANGAQIRLEGGADDDTTHGRVRVRTDDTTGDLGHVLTAQGDNTALWAAAGIYVQDTDPGAVGAGKLWVDTTALNLPIIRFRNADDDNWFDLLEAYRGLGIIELQTLDAILRLRRYSADGTIIRTELVMEPGDTRIRAMDEAGTLIAEWEVSTDGMGALIADELNTSRVVLESGAGASDETDARYELTIFDAASADKARFRLDETGIGIEGDLNLTLTNAPEVPATPTEQDIVDALIALGLVTQAAP